jgi:predicted DsbA family dithiol-disulfide isomerase
MTTSLQTTVQIEVWSDVVCPWCYIGKRRLETALSRFDHADEVEVAWHSFQLDPTHPKGLQVPVYEMLAKKFGAGAAQAKAMTGQIKQLAEAEGLEYDFDHAVAVNTVDAHRLSHLGATHGLGGATHERLMRAHLMEGAVVDDLETLVRLGVEVGIPEAEARQVLLSDTYTAEVEADGREAQQLGASGVPFFVINRRYGISGAQSADVFFQALQTAHTEATHVNG